MNNYQRDCSSHNQAGKHIINVLIYFGTKNSREYYLLSPATLEERVVATVGIVVAVVEVVMVEVVVEVEMVVAVVVEEVVMVAVEKMIVMVQPTNIPLP